MWPEKPHGARGYGDLALWYVCMRLCVMQNNNCMTFFFLFFFITSLNILLFLSVWRFYFQPEHLYRAARPKAASPSEERSVRCGKEKKSVEIFFIVSASLQGRKSSALLNKKDDFEFVFKNEHFLRRFRQKSGSSCASGVADVCRSLSRWCVRWLSRACVCWLLPSAAWSASTVSLKVLCASTTQPQGPHGESHCNRT